MITSSPSPSATIDPNATPMPSESPDATQAPSSDEKYSVSKFSDMAGYEWANVAVNKLHEKGIIYGITDDIFVPEREMTRAEFVTLLMRGYGLMESDASCAFKDVPYYTFT